MASDEDGVKVAATDLTHRRLKVMAEGRRMRPGQRKRGDSLHEAVEQIRRLQENEKD